MTPTPLLEAAGVNTVSVGSEMLRRNVVPIATPARTGYSTSSGTPSIRVGGPSGQSLMISVACQRLRSSGQDAAWPRRSEAAGQFRSSRVASAAQPHETDTPMPACP